MQSIRTRRRRSRGIRRETGRMNWITSSHTEYTELDLRGGWIIEAIPNRLPRGGRKRADGTSGDGDVSFFSGKNSQGTFCELWRNTTESWTTHKTVDKIPVIAERRAASRRGTLSPAASSDIDSLRVGGRLKPHWRDFPDNNHTAYREFWTVKRSEVGC